MMYGYTEVVDSGGTLSLEKASCTLTATRVFGYIERATKAIPALSRSVLVLGHGLGYGSAYMADNTSAYITGVEISEQMVNHPRACKHDKVDVINADAWDVVFNSPIKFDTVFVDIFTDSIGLPDMVMEPAFVQQCLHISNMALIYNVIRGIDADKVVKAAGARAVLVNWDGVPEEYYYDKAFYNRTLIFYKGE